MIEVDNCFLLGSHLESVVCGVHRINLFGKLFIILKEKNTKHAYFEETRTYFFEYRDWLLTYKKNKK